MICVLSYQRKHQGLGTPHRRPRFTHIPFVVIGSTCLVQLGRYRLSPFFLFFPLCTNISLAIHSKLESGHLYQSYAAIMAKVEVFQNEIVNTFKYSSNKMLKIKTLTFTDN